MDSKKAIKQLKALENQGKEMRLAAEKWKTNFQTLIAIILSARTKDETTIKVCKKLFKKYPNVKKLSSAKQKDIEKIIKPINFYKNKSKNIIKASEFLIENYNGRVPEDFEKLMKIPGVGRKTANVYLVEEAKENKDAIGVDTHVSYISQKLKWVKASKPEKIESELKKLFPKKYWKEINPVLVRFGKTYTSRKEKDKILEEIKKVE